MTTRAPDTAAPHPMDPRGLIREAFRIEGIGPEDCRSIFFDWAMGLAPGTDAAAAAKALRAHHADAPDGHPMIALLQQAETEQSAGGRGRASRRRRRAQDEAG